MTYRKNVAIKTKYNTIQECIEQCRDYRGNTVFTGALSKGISGSMTDSGCFALSSRKRYGNLFEFVGRVEHNEDGIYMVGDIRPRSFAKYLSYFGVGFGLIVGTAMMIVSNVDNYLRLFGFVFILFPWINILILRYSNSLYRHLISKVTCL